MISLFSVYWSISFTCKIPGIHHKALNTLNDTDIVKWWAKEKENIFFICFVLLFRPSLYIFLYHSLSFLKVSITLMLFSISFYGRLFDFFPTFTERTNSLPF